MRTSARVALAAAALIAATAVLLPLRMHVNLTTVTLLLMLCVVGCALRLGRVAAFAAAFLAALDLNFFFIPPYNTFSIHAPENLIAFAVFLLTGLLVAHLSSSARAHQERAEQQRTHAEHLYTELERAISVNAAREAEIQGEKIKSAFLDAVTHDLRTPLTSIKAAATSLQHERWSTEDRLAEVRMREMLAVIVEESDRLNRFIENMIELARRRQGSPLQLQPTSIAELVDAALERARGRLSDRRVEVEIPPGLPPLPADRDAIAEVIYTLLDNAAKYSGTYSRIDVRACATEEGIEVAVEDEGRGIPAELRTRVFERFARADAREQGFGMGLAIAQAIIAAHGGRIWIDGRRTGRGVVVRFVLPVKPVAVQV